MDEVKELSELIRKVMPLLDECTYDSLAKYIIKNGYCQHGKLHPPSEQWHDFQFHSEENRYICTKCGQTKYCKPEDRQQGKLSPCSCDNSYARTVQVIYKCPRCGGQVNKDRFVQPSVPSLEEIEKIVFEAQPVGI